MKIDLDYKVSWTKSRVDVRIVGCHGISEIGLFGFKEEFINCSEKGRNEIRRISQSSKFDPKIKQIYKEIREPLKMDISVIGATSFVLQGNLPAALKTIMLN